MFLGVWRMSWGICAANEDVWAALDCLGGIRGLSPCRFKSGWSLYESYHVFTTFPLSLFEISKYQNLPMPPFQKWTSITDKSFATVFFYFTHEWSLVVEQATGTPFGRFLVRSEVLPLVSLCNWKSGWWARRQEGKLKIPEGHTATAEQLRDHF